MIFDDKGISENFVMNYMDLLHKKTKLRSHWVVLGYQNFKAHTDKISRGIRLEYV